VRKDDTCAVEVSACRMMRSTSMSSKKRAAAPACCSMTGQMKLCAELYGHHSKNACQAVAQAVQSHCPTVRVCSSSIALLCSCGGKARLGCLAVVLG
jgi:hypothetical protein